MENAVSDFIGVLGKRAPNVEATVDASADPNGETFIDIRAGGFSTEVSYRPVFGFGIYIKNGAFGQRPDEIFRHADKAVTRVLQLRDAFEKEGSIKQLTLAEMTMLVEPAHDSDITSFSHIQRIIGLFEQIGKLLQQMERSDESLEKIDKYIQEIDQGLQIELFAEHIRAMGGRVEMDVVFDDMEARLELPLG